MFMRLMRPLNNWLLKKFVPDWQNTRNHTVRMSYGIVQGYVSIVINILLFVIKFSIGTLVGSTALIADAFHTLGDLASSVALILGFRMARKPGDR